jgi:hypothetical protein
VSKSFKLSVELPKSSEDWQHIVHSNTPYFLLTPLKKVPSDFLKQFAFVVSMLSTPGEVLASPPITRNVFTSQTNTFQHLREVTLRSSPFWMKSGDCASWVQLLCKFSVFVEDAIEDKE